MEEIIRLAALAIIAAVLIDLLRQYNRSYSILAATAVCVGFLLYLLQKLAPLLAFAKELAQLASSTDFGCVLKAVGIAILVQAAADLCTDCDQKALAGRLILAGRAAIILATLPLFRRLAQLIGVLLGSS